MLNLKVIKKIIIQIIFKNYGRKIREYKFKININKPSKELLFINSIFSLKDIYSKFNKKDYEIFSYNPEKFNQQDFDYISNFKNIIVSEEIFELMQLKDIRNIICLWHGGVNGIKNFSNNWYLNYKAPFSKIIVDSNNIDKSIKYFKLDKNNIFNLGNLKLEELYKNNNSNKKKEILKKANINKNIKKIYFFTFSFEERPKFTANLFFSFKKLEKYLNDDELIIYNFHPSLYFYNKLPNNIYTSNKIRHINNISTDDLILISDVLITDYSSTYVGALILNKPIIFLIESFYGYDRGFVVKKDKFPGLVLSTKKTKKIINKIRYSNSIINNENYIKWRKEINFIDSKKNIINFIKNQSKI